MLLRLVSGAEETDFVLVKTTVETPVTDILQAFLADQHLTLISLEGEGAVSKYQEGGKNISGDEVRLSDLLGWHSDGPYQPLAAKVLDKLENKERKLVVLDCLTELLVLRSEQEVAQLLAKLQKHQASVQKSKLLAVLHSDCLEEELVAAVEHSATSVLKVENCLKAEERLVSVRHRKPGGRQVTSKELVSRGKQGGIKVRQYCEEKEQQVEEEDVEESINKLTTFNLNARKESEQEAKSALVKFPYLSALQLLFQVLPFYTDEQKRVAGIGEQQVNI